jgi:hypothetical protein
MKAAVGIALMIAGVASGVYLGLWWAFIGGIVDVISEIRSPDLNALNVAIGVAKVFFAGAIGWFSALVGIVPGYAIATGRALHLKATTSR